MYGYDIRSESAVIFYTHSFYAVKIYDIKNFDSWEHMHDNVTRYCNALNRSKEVLPVIES